MSNVIRASALYSATDKQAIVGKIYEDLFTDENGNTSLRYVRLIKATAAIKKAMSVNQMQQEPQICILLVKLVL